jgi:phosphatidate cytidylyltransferase
MIERFITGSILVWLSVFFIVMGGPFIFGGVLGLAILCTNELHSMLEKQGYKSNFILEVLGIIFIFSWFYLQNNIALFKAIPIKIFILALLLFFIAEVFMKKIFLPKNTLLITLRIILYFSVTIGFIYLLRMGKFGLFNLLITAILIWTTDSFALFGGKRFGKRKLTEISPKKTVEGSLCGLGATVVVTLFFIYFFKLNFWLYLILGITIGITSQIGDLHESLTKRSLNTKDSASILPGHGGFYDRLDSSLITMPIVFFLLNW